MVAVVAGCGEAARTFEDGVEHLPGPATFVVRVDPGAAADASEIEFLAYDDAPMRTSPARRGAERYLTGITLPSTLRAHLDGVACRGSIDLMEDLEVDATLTVVAGGCELRLDLVHRLGSVDHQLRDAP